MIMNLGSRADKQRETARLDDDPANIVVDYWLPSPVPAGPGITDRSPPGVYNEILDDAVFHGGPKSAAVTMTKGASVLDFGASPPTNDVNLQAPTNVMGDNTTTAPGVVAGIERGCSEVGGGAGAHCQLQSAVGVPMSPQVGGTAPTRDPWQDNQTVTPISAQLPGARMNGEAYITDPGMPENSDGSISGPGRA
jgi:hypothetical protein